MRRALCLVAAALPLAGASLFGLPFAPKSTDSGPQPLTFFGIADWGGQQEAPYVNAGQLECAQAMGTVAAEAGDHPAFVLGAGDNFYMDGLPGLFNIRRE